MPVSTLIVNPEEAELRLDRWFKRRFPDLTHGRLEKLLRTGQVRLDGKRAKAADRVVAGQRVRVPPLGPTEPAAKPPPQPKVSAADDAALRSAIIYQDDWLMAIDKPPGLAVQGGSGQTRHLDAMLESLRFGRAERPRLVHRLDRDTSGVLLLARSAQAATRLAACFRDKRAEKLYWAAVRGLPKEPSGRLDLPLGKRPGPAGERVTVDSEHGKRAITLYRVLDKAQKQAAWLELQPLTGRTHQLRVHCATLGTPILGDGKYGGKAAFLTGDGVARRLHLHAARITLPHPDGSGRSLSLSAQLPPHMRATWRFFGFQLR